MGKLTIADGESSNIAWDHLEELVCMEVREFIQAHLEEEITELLGRSKLEWRKVLDSPEAYWDGYGKGRKPTLGLVREYHGAPADGKGSGGAFREPCSASFY